MKLESNTVLSSRSAIITGAKTIITKKGNPSCIISYCDSYQNTGTIFTDSPEFVNNPSLSSLEGRKINIDIYLQ